MSDFGPEVAAYFSTTRRRVNDTHQMGLSQNQFQREGVKNAYGRSRANLVRQYAQLANRLPGAYNRRGLLNSGIYQRAQADFSKDRQRSYADLLGQRNDQLGQLFVSDLMLNQTRSGAISDLDELQEARRQAASLIRASAGF
jgi:hypothetical protein